LASKARHFSIVWCEV